MSTNRDTVAHADLTQVVAFTATPANAAAIGSQSYRVRLVATSAALVSFNNVVGMYLAPNVPERFLIKPNTVISVVEVSAAGNLYITEEN